MNKFFNALKYFFTEEPNNEDQILIKAEGKEKYLYMW